MPLYSDDATRMRIARRCMWIFTMFTAMCVYGIGSENRRIEHDTDIALHPANTTGAVFYVHAGKGGEWFNYRYSVDGAYYEGKASGYLARGALPGMGESIKVTYSTAHPQWSVAGDIEEQPGSRARIFLLAALACAAVTFLAYRYAKPARSIDD